MKKMPSLTQSSSRHAAYGVAIYLSSVGEERQREVRTPESRHILVVSPLIGMIAPGVLWTHR